MNTALYKYWLHLTANMTHHYGICVYKGSYTIVYIELCDTVHVLYCIRLYNSKYYLHGCIQRPIKRNQASTAVQSNASTVLPIHTLNNMLCSTSLLYKWPNSIVMYCVRFKYGAYANMWRSRDQTLYTWSLHWSVYILSKMTVNMCSTAKELGKLWQGKQKTNKKLKQNMVSLESYFWKN